MDRCCNLFCCNRLPMARRSRMWWDRKVFLRLMKNYLKEKVVPEEGIEPTRSCLHWILSPARLPISPLRHEWELYRTVGLCATNRARAERRVDTLERLH